MISEIPFDLANYGVFFNFGHQNIFWTLFLSALGIHWLEKNKELGMKFLICLVILFLALIIRIDYSVYGIGIILSFYFCKKSKISPIILIALLSIIVRGIFKFQYFAFLGLIPVLMFNGQQGRKTGNIYYSFYAVHLGIFAFIIKYLMIN